MKVRIQLYFVIISHVHKNCNGLMHSSLCQNNHVFVIYAVLVLFAVMMNVLSLHLRTHRFQDCKNLTFSNVQEYYALVLKLFSGSSGVENGD